jgi:2-C-methyl-D-erythritol 2,4-cyclodiphosphate synthase
MASTTILFPSQATQTASTRRTISFPSRNPNLSSVSFAKLRNGSLRSTRQELRARATLQVESQDSVKQSSSPPPSLPYRIGHGFDLHRLEPGLPLIIGGINIPHDRGCEAHSDGN